jgi:prevent-host-death family protein
MQQYNIHEAKTHLSSLIDGAIKGNPFVIAKAGKPVVKVVPCCFQEPKKAKELIANEENILLFSAASIWEITIKNGLARPDFQVDAYMLHNGLLNNGYTEIAFDT